MVQLAAEEAAAAAAAVAAVLPVTVLLGVETA